MDRVKVARELVDVAKMLRLARVWDLADVKSVVEETRKKLKVIADKKKEMEENMNLEYDAATAALEKRTAGLLAAIKDALVDYFNSVGIGVKRADAHGGLVEVFLGSKDGVKREQSKVSAMVSLTWKGEETATYMLRSEDLEGTREGELVNNKTVDRLMGTVKKMYKSGFWSKSEEE
jgi:predicted Zn-dependent protease